MNADRPAGWRQQLWVVIFEADTPAGRAFDVALLIAILVSIVAVMLESVPSIGSAYGRGLRAFEWLITGLFTVEYVLRLGVARRPVRYARSFFGVVDLLAILPSYVSLVLPGSQSLLTIRGLRLLRIIRIFKLARYLGPANMLITALRSSGRKVVIFFGTVLLLVLVLGSAMYLIEGESSGFTSIPTSVYWAVVTLTTVGYGNLVPVTTVGKALAAAAMIMGYSIIAVPTGIVTAELMQTARDASPSAVRGCPDCLSSGHEPGSRFCKDCGASLPADRS